MTGRHHETAQNAYFALALPLVTVATLAVASQAFAGGSNDRFGTTGPAALPAG